jgi:hypothetical protein
MAAVMLVIKRRTTIVSILALLCDTSLSTLLISREHHQLLIVDVLQLWAAQLAQDASEILVYHVEHAQRDVRLGLCSKLVREASGIIALEQSCSVEDASGEVGDINTGESVGRSEVTANIEEFGLCDDARC